MRRRKRPARTWAGRPETRPNAHIDLTEMGLGPIFRARRVGFSTRRRSCCGAVAQLGERRVRNAKVRGSIPLGSTNLLNDLQPFSTVENFPLCPKCAQMISGAGRARG